MSVLLASPLDLRMYHKCHTEQEGTEGADKIVSTVQLHATVSMCG